MAPVPQPLGSGIDRVDAADVPVAVPLVGGGVSRRRFLAMAGGTAGALAAVAYVRPSFFSAAAAGASPATGNTLVQVFLRGGVGEFLSRLFLRIGHRRRHLRAALRGRGLELVIRLRVIGHHLLTEGFGRRAFALFLGHASGSDFSHAGLSRLHHEIGIGRRRRGV